VSATVEHVVRELKKAGPLNDPRIAEVKLASGEYVPNPMRTIPLRQHVREEVQRSIERVSLKFPDLSPDAAARMQAAERQAMAMMQAQRDYAKAAKSLRKTQHPALIAEADRMERSFWQEPPARSNMLKGRCAEEAYDLMTWFSAKPPNGSATGAYRKIAELIYGAQATKVANLKRGKKGVDNLKRACDRVLKERRRYA
jgi:hypothetical protein